MIVFTGLPEKTESQIDNISVYQLEKTIILGIDPWVFFSGPSYLYFFFFTIIGGVDQHFFIKMTGMYML